MCPSHSSIAEMQNLSNEMASMLNKEDMAVVRFLIKCFIVKRDTLRCVPLSLQLPQGKINR